MNQASDRDQMWAKINQQFAQGDYNGAYETFYSGVGQNTDLVPWAHATVHPRLMEWLQKNDLQGKGKRAIVIGCGLGDDAQKLAELGFQVTAFDVSPSAIAWAKQRFPDSIVDYHVADLFHLPAEWLGQFDFILEIYTVQALPQALRETALKAIPTLLKKGGQLLLICLGREHDITPQGPPWAISKQELQMLQDKGLTISDQEDFVVGGRSRQFRILYSYPFV